MGMVVRTNTMALNAYRQLGMNNNAVSKSLEKLSSGFRINRAADDAAGLAISEKMKAQIKGLETASANAQDGISLLQTAEGNLSEVHNMLNRMVELATKSANGTYTITEREALQDEVDQLLDEVNRISKSANFNGAKLLDGSLDGEGREIVGKTTFNGLGNFSIYGNRMVGANKVDAKGSTTLDADGVEDPQLHQEATGSAKTSFAYRLNDRTITADKDGNAVFKFGIGTMVDNTGDSKDAIVEKEITLKVGANEVIGGERLAQEIYKAIATDGKVTLHMDGAAADTAAIEYEVKIGADGESLEFVMSDAGYDTAVAAAKENPPKDYFKGNFTFGLGIDKANGGKGTVNSTNDIASSVINVGSPDGGKRLAETILMIDDGDFKDGAGYQIGDEYYVFATSDKTANAKYGDNVKVVDLRSLANADGTAVTTDKISGVKGTHRALAKLTEVAKDNKMFDVQVDQGGCLALTEKKTNTKTEVLTTVEGLKSQIQKFTGTTTDVTKVGGNGAPLTLQIGDTADEYNKMKVNIADMSAAGLGINGLDITSEASASKAIDTIKNAINTVSSARAGMGALQNRLDYTINNLDVAVENLSAANSRIRDTDMAKEMMNYTKMNVLVQSAQAMLAQANQQPQSVLQLLQ